jgi:putative addiction module killer protein
VTASPGSSILPFGSLGDPFGLEYNIPTHSKTVATIATKPITIPQYTHDISHSLACESRKSFSRTPSRRQTIHPLGCLGGRAPLSEWLASPRDNKARAKIRVRLDRVNLDNLGDCHSVGDGVQELRFDYGPGYRVYFGQVGSTIVLLLLWWR